MFHRGWFWIHGIPSAWLDNAVQVVRQYGVARLGAFDQHALTALEEPGKWAGLLSEVTVESLPRLDQLRSHAPVLPVLAVVRTPEAGLLNALQARGAEIVIPPVDVSSLTAFVQRAFAMSFFPDDRVARFVEHLARRCALTPREVQLVSFCLGGEPRARMRRRLGISENTLKTQIKGLLRKSNERSLDSLAKNVLRAALVGERALDWLGPVAPWLPVGETYAQSA